MRDKEFVLNGRKGFVNMFSDADESVFNEIFVEKEYKILDEFIKNAKFPIFDIGAHKGMFSIYARCLNGLVPIFAFEPEEDNIRSLKENLRMNSIKGVVVKGVAVAAGKGNRELFLSADSHNHSIVNRWTIDGELKIRNVECVSLDDVFEKYNLSRVSVVKMDCEGAEFEILWNLSSGTLNKVDVFYVEYHKYFDSFDPSLLKKIFEKNKFKVSMKPSYYGKNMGFILAVKR
ncbi:MAG: FkbM family methyltransferase [Patescibacteria group bacterium]